MRQGVDARTRLNNCATCQKLVKNGRRRAVADMPIRGNPHVCWRDGKWSVLHNIHTWAGHVARYSAYSPARWSALTTRWKDSEYLFWKRLCSSDWCHLYRGHRRKPWRWEQTIMQSYNFRRFNHFRSVDSTLPVWRRVAMEDKSLWDSSRQAWASWRILRASNIC